MNPSSNTPNDRAEKKAQFSECCQTKTKNNRTILLISMIGLAIVAALYFFGPGKASTATQASVARAENGFVSVPLAELADGKAKFFNYVTSSNKPIRFFAIKSADGAYRAAADACDECYKAKLGYYQEGDDLVCRKCGRHFPSNDVNEVHGGCNPSGVPVRVQGDKLLIASSDLDSRADLF